MIFISRYKGNSNTTCFKWVRKKTCPEEASISEVDNSMLRHFPEWPLLVQLIPAISIRPNTISVSSRWIPLLTLTGLGFLMVVIHISRKSDPLWLLLYAIIKQPIKSRW